MPAVVKKSKTGATPSKAATAASKAAVVAAEVAAAVAAAAAVAEALSLQPSSSSPVGIGAWDIKLPGWKAGQVTKAASSLLKFIGTQQANSAELFAEDEQVLYLLIALKKMPLRSRKDKPVPLPLPHPLYTSEGMEICLFVKDSEGEGHKEAKKRLTAFEKNGGIAKVVGVSKLRTKYESHEAKRQLCKLYDLFLADDRILPSLPKLIGKSFFKKKKQPIPINLRTKDWAAQVSKACANTYMFKNSGTSISIKIARSSFTAQQVVDNVHSALLAAVEHVPKKWAALQAVYIKTAESVSLPLYQALPDAPIKI